MAPLKALLFSEAMTYIRDPPSYQQVTEEQAGALKTYFSRNMLNLL